MMKRKPVKLTAIQEDEIKRKLQQLSQQDEIQLPESLRSSNLLAKLQDQPSFVRIDSDPAPRRRSVYVITTCAAALLLVVGLARFMPGLGASGNGFSLAAQTGTSSSMAMAAQNKGGISDYQEIISALQYLTSAGSNAANSTQGQKGLAPIAEDIPETSEDTAQPEEEPASGAVVRGINENMDTAGGVPDTSPAVSGSATGESSQEATRKPLQAPAGEMKRSSSETSETEDNASSQISSGYEEAPAFENEEEDAVPYILEEAPYISYSDPVSATGEWAYWLDVQNNTLQQLNSKTMEQAAKALIPSSAAVAYMESYGDLVACIDPYQLSYYDDSSLVSAENPGITVYLYQTGGESSLQLVNVVSMSGSYETSYLSSSGLLYLVSNQSVYADEETIEDVLKGFGSEEPELNSRLSNVLPVVYNKTLDEAPSLMPPAQISLIGTPVDLNYLNVMVIDLANGGSCTFWGFLGRKGSIAVCDNTISMVASDGEGGSQLVSIDFSNDRVSYRLSLSIAPMEEQQTEIASSAPSSENTYYPPQAKNPGT